MFTEILVVLFLFLFLFIYLSLNTQATALSVKIQNNGEVTARLGHQKATKEMQLQLRWLSMSINEDEEIEKFFITLPSRTSPRG